MSLMCPKLKLKETWAKSQVMRLHYIKNDKISILFCSDSAHLSVLGTLSFEACPFGIHSLNHWLDMLEDLARCFLSRYRTYHLWDMYRFY